MKTDLVTVLVFHIEAAKVARLGRFTITVGERVQALDALGHRAGKAPLAGQFGDEEHVVRGLYLI